MIPYEVHKLHVFGQEISLWFTMIYLIAWPLIFYYCIRESKRRKDIDFNNIIQMLVFVLLGILAGSRAFAFFGPWSVSCAAGAGFFQRLAMVLNPHVRGAIGFGAMIGAILFSYIFLKIKKANFSRYFDLAAIPIAFGIFLTKIGCFLAGCCFGSATNVPWAIIRDGIAIHPTQLYDSLINLGILLFLLRLNEKRERENKFDGYSILSFLMLYSVTRFITEFTRGDYAAGNYHFGFTSSQVVAFVIFCTALVIFVIKSMQHVKKQKTKSRYHIRPKTYAIALSGGLIINLGAYIVTPLPYLSAALIILGLIIFFFGLRSIFIKK